VSWGRTVIVSMAYIGPLVDRETVVPTETKGSEEGTSAT